jgi:hypothetical protein
MQTGNTAKHYVSRAQTRDQFSQQTAISFDSTDTVLRKRFHRRNDRSHCVERRRVWRQTGAVPRHVQDARAREIRQRER